MRIFEANITDFTNNGIGLVPDAVSCIVTQTINSSYELQMQYPVNGIRYESMQLRNIITADADPMSGEQPFRIYRITKPLNGIITVYARHIAYDLQGYVDSPFSASTLAETLTQLNVNSSVTTPFTFDTDKSVASPFVLEKPMSIWDVFSGWQGSLLDTYGGEFEFDNLNVFLHNHRGQDRGVTIAYGKNLTSYTQDQNNTAVYTGAYPYWFNGESLVSLPEKTIDAPGTYDFTRILSLDLTSYFEEAPDEDALRTRANAYIAENDIGIPKVSWTISFVQLEQSEEYRGTAILTRVLLGDTVHVRFPMYGVTASARATTVKYNSLLKRYESVTLGNVKTSLAQTIAIQAKEIEQKPSQTMTQLIAESLAQGLLGANDGIVRLLDTNGDGAPDELYIADNADPSLAVNVWRFNSNGWAASKTGYNGTYTMGATIEDGLLADFVTAARLTAGTIQSADGSTFYLDLDNGILNMDVNSLSLNGENMSVIIDGIEQNATDKVGVVQDDLNDLRAHIIIGSDGSMTFTGASGNNVTLRIVNNQLGIFDSETSVATFSVDGAVMPNATIPQGGSLTMGKFKWTPRTNGNLSLLYIG